MALHPEARAAVEAAADDLPVWTEGYDVVGAREANRAIALQEQPEDVAGVVDLDADGVPVRLFRPAATDPGLLVHLHGGGFVFHDSTCTTPRARRLANRLGMAVLSVDYRLAARAPVPCRAGRRRHGARVARRRVDGAGASAGRRTSTVTVPAATWRWSPPCATPAGSRRRC